MNAVVAVIVLPRPVAVTAMDTPVALPGYLHAPADAKGIVDKGSIAPSLIRMSNGGIVRNLMGGTAGDSHDRRIWGTKAYVDQTDEDDIRVRVGGAGCGDRGGGSGRGACGAAAGRRRAGGCQRQVR